MKAGRSFLWVSVAWFCYACSGTRSVPTGAGEPGPADGSAVVNSVIDLDRVDHHLLGRALNEEANRVRQIHRKRVLKDLPLLWQVARMHARDMVDGRFFGHENRHDPGKRTLKRRLKRFQLIPRFAGENLVQIPAQAHVMKEMIQTSSEGEAGRMLYIMDEQNANRITYADVAQTAIEVWMESDLHRMVLLGSEAQAIGSACHLGEDRNNLMVFTCVQVYFRGAVAGPESN